MIPTREHWRIKKWAVEQGAFPAQLHRRVFDGEPAILTFGFGNPKSCGQEIVPISWEMFFAQFDLLELSVAFDDRSPQFTIVKVDKLSAGYPGH